MLKAGQKSRVYRSLWAASAVSTIAAFVPAHAETAPTPAEPEATSYADIVVTAQKRSESLQNVPLTVNVVSGEALTDMSIERFEEMALHVPGLAIQGTPNSYAIFMRGLGSPPGNLAFEQSVGLFIDGVYAGRSRQYHAPFLDIERVEVLKGPQGTLFGKNTIAGAVSIVTAKPGREFEAEATAEHDFSYGGYRLSGFVSAPISDTLGIRIAGELLGEEGFLKNTNRTGDREAETNEWMLRGTLAWQPSDGFDATLKIQASEQDVTGSTAQASVLPEPFLTRARAIDPLAEGRLDHHKSNGGIIDTQDFDNTDSFNTVLTLNHYFGDHTVTSITGYSKFDYQNFQDSDYTPLPLLTTGFGEDFEQISQELRLASPQGRQLEYLVGLYYLSSESSVRKFNDFRIGAFNGFSDRNAVTEDEVYALFGQASLSFFDDRLKAIAGARVSRETKKVHSTHVRTGSLPPSYVPFDVRDSVTEEGIDPSFKLQYSPNDDVMLYASFAKGTKAGGFVVGDPNLTSFEFSGEKALAYELGAKLTFLNGAANLNISAFKTDYSDLQVNRFDGLNFTISNAASATTKGIEVDGLWRVAPGVTLQGSGAYLDATYDDFPGGACLFGAPPGCVSQNLAGERLILAPEWKFSGNINVVQPLNDSLNLGGMLSVAHTSRVFFAQDLDPADSQAAFTKIDARISLADSDERWELALVGKNLTDKLTKRFSFDTPGVPGGHTAFTDPPRTIAMQATLRF